jgi:hypothetical protein
MREYFAKEAQAYRRAKVYEKNLNKKVLVTVPRGIKIAL